MYNRTRQHGRGGWHAVQENTETSDPCGKCERGSIVVCRIVGIGKPAIAGVNQIDQRRRNRRFGWDHPEGEWWTGGGFVACGIHGDHRNDMHSIRKQRSDVEGTRYISVDFNTMIYARTYGLPAVTVKAGVWLEVMLSPVKPVSLAACSLGTGSTRGADGINGNCKRNRVNRSLQTRRLLANCDEMRAVAQRVRTVCHQYFVIKRRGDGGLRDAIDQEGHVGRTVRPDTANFKTRFPVELFSCVRSSFEATPVSEAAIRSGSPGAPDALGIEQIIT